MKKDVCERVFRELNRSGIALFFYLYNNKEGYELFLSSKEFCDKYGVSQTQYYEAVKKLIEKNYLVEVFRNVYEFHAIPVEITPVILPMEKRLFIEADTGNSMLLTYREVKELTGDEDVALQIWKNAKPAQQAIEKKKEAIQQKPPKIVELPPVKPGKAMRPLYDLDKIIEEE